MDSNLSGCAKLAIYTKGVCYVTAFYDMNRDNWSHYSRTFEDYLLSFLPFVDLFTRYSTGGYEMVVFIDKKHQPRLQEIVPSNIGITLIGIDEEFMKNNIPMWSTIPREREIMNSPTYKKMIQHRSHCPETYIPEYTMINHCKIDFIGYTIDNLSTYQYLCWVDFGYFKKPEWIPTTMIDINKLDKDRVNYTLINKLTVMDSDPIYTLRYCPERVGGFFFFGNRDILKEYQALYHKMLYAYQYSYRIADDDQALVLACYFEVPDMFRLHYTGKWHIALKYFSILNGNET